MQNLHDKFEVFEARNKEAEAGIIYNDEDLGIDWKFPKNKLIISDKDLILPTLKNARL